MFCAIGYYSMNWELQDISGQELRYGQNCFRLQNEFFQDLKEFQLQKLDLIVNYRKDFLLEVQTSIVFRDLILNAHISADRVIYNFFQTSLESTGHFRWNIMIGPLILQRYLKNSFLDERIISCHFKIIGLFSCKRYIGKFLIVENLIVCKIKVILQV